MKKPPCQAAFSEIGVRNRKQKLGHLIPRSAKVVNWKITFSRAISFCLVPRPQTKRQ
jgi:hypothetical protein